jgi:hypothetical protein
MLYDIYVSLLMQGLLESYLSETFCPKYPHACPARDCPQKSPAALELTSSTVARKVFFLEKDEHDVLGVVERTVEIALARCPVCKSRFRVLPADILPRKLYSLSVIELSVSLYNRGDLSLCRVVWDELYGERTPMPTTLHGWTEGLGAYCLGRYVGEVPGTLPAARILAELECRYGQIKNLHQTPLEVNPQRYRSEARRDRLEACKRFQLCCGVLGSKAPWMFSELNCLILALGNSCGFGFRTGICCTPIEHLDSVHVGQWLQNAPKEPLPCPIHGRSPPGDSR